MKYYLISGEASGDLHGSNLVRELRLLDRQAEVRAWGGDLVQAAGATLVKHYRELAFMGFAEVIRNLPAIFRNIRFCKEDILAWQPDVLVLVDYPGFNLRIAKWAKQHGFKVVYYISPQVWAWKESRVAAMKRNIDLMLCILPFEKAWYKNKWNWDVAYVGHPLVEVVEDFYASPAANEKIGTDKKLIALLPGSRQQEIHKKLPVMLEVTRAFPGYHFVVAKAPGLEDAFYASFLAPYQNVSAVRGQTYSLLHQATAALVTSGTATLETALFGVPEIVCYKGNNLSYLLAKRLIRIKYISLVNLIMDKPVVKELIQDQMTTANLVRELQELLTNEARVNTLQHDYAELKQILSAGGRASAQAADKIYALISG